MKSGTFSSILIVLSTLVLSSPNVAQQTLKPTDNCRDHSASAIAAFADADLEEVVRNALSVDSGEDLTCVLLSELIRLTVPAESERVVYGGTLRPLPSKPFENLDGIQNLTNLTALSIINRLITDISPISELTNLRVLNLHTNWFSDISPLIGLTNLEQLIISENPISDISALRQLTNLRQLHVHGMYPYQLQHYLNYKDGRDPDVVFNGITDISPLAGLFQLRLLRIHLNTISDISPLAGLTNLTHLRLYDNQITDIGALSGMNDLILLWIHNNQIDEINALSDMPGMLQLSLNNNAISNIDALSNMAELENLFLSNNKIEDIAPLRQLQNLQVLRLENNAINDISSLGNLRNLKELSLAHNASLYRVQPLLANEGIGRGDELDLRFTYVRCSDMDAFEDKGVTLHRVTALNGSACAGRRLEDP